MHVALSMCPGPYLSLAGHPPLVLLHPLCARLSPSPCELSSPVIFIFLVLLSSGGLFSCKGDGPSYFPLSVALNVVSPISLTHSPHPLSAWIIFHLEFSPTFHTPESTTCLFSLHRTHASNAVPQVCLPPLVALSLCPGPYLSLAGHPPLVLLHPLCPRLSPSSCESSSPVIFICLVLLSSGGLFSCKGDGPS